MEARYSAVAGVSSHSAVTFNVGYGGFLTAQLF